MPKLAKVSLPLTLFGKKTTKPPIPFLPSKNHYTVLELNPTGINPETQEYYTESERKKAYYLMALKYHPDKNLHDETANSKFQAVCQSFQFLENDERRTQFNKELRENPDAFNSNNDLVVQDDNLEEDFSKLWEAANFSSEHVLEVSMTSPLFGRAILENSSLLSFFLPSVQDQFELLFIMGYMEEKDALVDLLDLPTIKLIHQRLKDKVEGYEEAFVGAAQNKYEEASHFFKETEILFDLSFEGLNTLSSTNFEAFKTLIIVKKGELPIASLLFYKKIYEEQLQDLYQKNLSDLKKKQLKAYSVIYSIFKSKEIRAAKFKKALRCLDIEIFPLLKELSTLYGPTQTERGYTNLYRINWHVYSYAKNYLEALNILLPPSRNFDFSTLEEFYQEALYSGFLSVFKTYIATGETLSFPNNELVIFLLKKTSFDFYSNFVISYQDYIIKPSDREFYNKYILQHGEDNSPYFLRLYTEQFNRAYKVLNRSFLVDVFFGLLEQPYLTEGMQKVLAKIAAIKNYYIENSAKEFQVLKNEYERFRPFYEPVLSYETFSKALEQTGFFPELFKIQNRNLVREDSSRIQAIILRTAASQPQEESQSWPNSFLRHLTTYFDNQHEEYSYQALLHDYKKHYQAIMDLAEKKKSLRGCLISTLKDDAELSACYISGGFLYLYILSSTDDNLIKETPHFNSKYSAFDEIRRITENKQSFARGRMDEHLFSILEQLKSCALDKITFNYLKKSLITHGVFFRGLVTLIAEKSDIPILGNITAEFPRYFCTENDLYTLAFSSFYFLERYLKEYPAVSGNHLLELLNIRERGEKERVTELYKSLGLKDRYLRSANLELVLSKLAKPSDGGLMLVVVPKANNAMESRSAHLLRQWLDFFSPSNEPIETCQLYAFYKRLEKEKKVNSFENSDIEALVKTYKEDISLYSWLVGWLFERKDAFPLEITRLFEDLATKRQLHPLINKKIFEINRCLNVTKIHADLIFQIINILKEYHRSDLDSIERAEGECLDELKCLEIILNELSSNFSQKYWDAYKTLMDGEIPTFLRGEEAETNQFRP